MVVCNYRIISRYEGNFEDNKFDGYGELQDSNGFIYKGEWK